MPITWAEAVADESNPDDESRFRRALAQVAELEPLVQSFVGAVKSSGQWPTYRVSEYRDETAPTTVHTRGTYSPTERCLWVTHDGSWGLNDFVYSTVHTDRLLKVVSGRIDFDGESTAWKVMTSTRFDSVMAAMEKTKDWVPRELVGYLREHNIPIPTDH
jgi:hypothetical protein